MLASCKNCCHFGGGSLCELGQRPAEGDLYCSKYAISIAFREELLRLLRADLQREINRAVAKVRIAQAEQGQSFAG